MIAAEQSASLHEIAFGNFLAERSTGTEPDAGLTDALSCLFSELVAELVYNERHNELQFVKYLS
jgi:hypothetical protein